MDKTQLFNWGNQSQITSLIGKYSIIMKTDNLCLSSSDHKQVGKHLIFPKKFFSYRQPKTISVNGSVQTLVPLKHNNSTAAIMLTSQIGRDLKNYLPLIQNLAELSLEQYIQREKAIPDTTDHFINRLINSTDGDLSSFQGEAKILGHDLSSSRIAIILHLINFESYYLLKQERASFEHESVITKWKTRIENAFNSFFSANKDVITSYIGDDKFLLLKAVRSEEEKDKIYRHLKKSRTAIFGTLQDSGILAITIGCSSTHKGVKGIRNAFHEADLAVELGQKLSGENNTYYYSDLGLLRILAEPDMRQKVNYATQILGKVKNKNLSLTLEAFLDHNLNLAETARKLKIHRNTAIYRLNQISQILNLDPRDFDQAVTIKVAFLIKKFFAKRDS